MANWRPVIEAALDDIPSAASPTYTDLCQYIRDDGGYDLRRGRKDDRQRFNPATFAMTLDNRLATFDPSQDPRIIPNKRARISLEYPWLPGMLANGGFEKGITDWATSGTALSLTAVTSATVAADPGGKYATIGFSGTGAGYIGSGAVVVTPSTAYAVSARLKPTFGAMTGALIIDWYSDAGATTLISSSTVTLALSALVAWNRIGQAVTSPGTAIRAKVRVGLSVANAGCTLRMDSVVFDAASFQGVYSQAVGFVDAWKRDWDIGDSLCHVTATDGFKVHGNKEMNSTTYKDTVLAYSPSWYYRMSDAGVNSIESRFVDTVTGDNGAVSVIYAGVGPLYNIAGGIATDVDGAFSTLGPSSSDFGWVDLPRLKSIVGNGVFTLSMWFRSPKGDHTVLVPLYEQGNYAGTASKNTWLTVALSGDTAVGSPSFYPLGSVLVNINDFSSGVGMQFAPPAGINLFDQAWHQVTVIRTSATGWKVLVDGVLAGTSVQTSVSFTADTPVHIGATFGTGVGVPQQAEIDEVWMAPSALTTANVLALYNLGRFEYPQEKSDVRIARVLALDGWPVSLENLDAGTENMELVAAPFTDANVLQYLQKIEDSEQGWLFMDKNGAVRWIARHNLYTGARTTTIAGPFGNGAGEIPYADITLVDDDLNIFNRGIVSRSNNGAVHRVDDLASQQDHFIRSITKSDVLLTSEDSTQGAAGHLVDLYKKPGTRITQMKLEGIAGDAVMQQICQREIGDWVKVRSRQPGLPAAGGAGTYATGTYGAGTYGAASASGYIEYTAVIHGISMQGSRGKLTVTWDLSSAHARRYFAMGDVFGSYPMGW